LQVFWF